MRCLAPPISTHRVAQTSYTSFYNNWNCLYLGNLKHYSRLKFLNDSHLCRQFWILLKEVKYVSALINPFHAADLFWYPPENIRKPQVFWCFQGVSKEISGMKWVNALFISNIMLTMKSKVSNVQISRKCVFYCMLWNGSFLLLFVWRSTCLLTSTIMK